MPTEVATNVHDQVRGEVRKVVPELRAHAHVSKFEVSANTAIAVLEKLELDIVVMESVCAGVGHDNLL